MPPLRQIGGANRFRRLCFCGACHLLFTTIHSIPQVIRQVSQTVHERLEDKTVDLCVRLIRLALLAWSTCWGQTLTRLVPVALYGTAYAKIPGKSVQLPELRRILHGRPGSGGAFNTLLPDNVPELR